MHDKPYKTLRSNVFNRIDLEELNINYTGQVISKSILHATSEIYITEYYTYTYDNAGRLKETKHRINTGNEVTLTNNSYNEIGQLSSRTYGNGLETQTFDYNIRGWLTESENELFSENLYYEKTANNNNGYYNGNISQSSFKYLTGNIHESGWRGNTNEWKENWETLDYTYDNLNRLTLAASNNVDRLSEQLSYDKHGNIKSLKRGGIVEHSWLDNGTTPNHVVGIIDSLGYNYNGNQLNDIVDNSNADAYYLGSQDLKQSSVSAPHCYFDNNGNMTTDLNKGIATISYNSLNLPDTVQMRDGNMVTYVHDASGLKDQVVRHTIATSGVTIPIGRTLRNCGTLYSVSSYSYTQYAGNAVYDNSKISRILLPDGILVRTNALTSSPPVFSYHYYLKDHLGNIRAVFEDDGEGGIVNQVSNYYPFGMEYGESAEDQTEVTYQNYLFGGKEFDRKYELNLSDFGARSYDATSGRWLTMDPLAEKYYSISPYAYCGNNPILLIDPEGLEWFYYADNAKSEPYYHWRDEQVYHTGKYENGKEITI